MPPDAIILHNGARLGIDMDHLGKRIQELRKAKGWSQPDLAKQVGASPTIIGRYERNDATPSVDAAKRVADAFGVTLDYLVSENAGENPLQDRDAYERCKALADLPEDDKVHAFYVIDSIVRNVKARIAYG